MKTMSKWMLSATTAAALILGMTVASDAEARGKNKHQPERRAAVQQPARHKQVHRVVVRQPVGHRVTVLPRGHKRVKVGKAYYRYHAGVFYRSTRVGYRVVAAPFGAVVARLPIGFTTFHVGARPYYVFNDTYYVWNGARRGYVVVARPVGVTVSAGVIAYPSIGQSPEQQARDRYECHSWAVLQSGHDPSQGVPGYAGERSVYDRSQRACLEGRGYSVR